MYKVTNDDRYKRITRINEYICIPRYAQSLIWRKFVQHATYTEYLSTRSTYCRSFLSNVPYKCCTQTTTLKYHNITIECLPMADTTITNDSSPPIAQLAVLQTAPERGNRRGKPWTHDACENKVLCRFCKREGQGKCKRLPADCGAHEEDLPASACMFLKSPILETRRRKSP